MLHVDGNWIELVTTQDSLHHLGLSNCTLLAHLRDLVADELQGSWQTLQHHSRYTPASLYQHQTTLESLIKVNILKSLKPRESSEKDVRILSSSDHLRLKRDGDDRKGALRCQDCDETIGMKEDLASDEWFKHYVRMHSELETSHVHTIQDYIVLMLVEL